MSTKTIGFVGIGQIGLPMAKHLLETGYDVIAFDHREDARKSIEAAGGNAAPSAAAVARDSDATHVVVVTDAQVKDVVFGKSGLISGYSGRDGLIVVHSTVTPQTIHEIVADSPESIDVLDAAVSGGYPRARTGDLTLMVGGELDVIEGHAGVLDAIGREFHHMGAAGNGMATKLLNNAILHAQEAATFEAVEFGKHYGLDEDALIAVFEQGTATNSAVQRWDYVTHDYFATHPRGVYGGAENTRKNLNQFLSMAADFDFPVPMAALTSQIAPRWKRKLANRVDPSSGE